MSELRDILHERHTTMAASLRDAAEFDASAAVRSVKVHRRGRAIVLGSSSLAVVAVIAVGTWLMLPAGEPAIVPASSPTPTPSASSTATPTPTPTPTPSASTSPSVTPSPTHEPEGAELTYVTPTACDFLTPAMVLDAAAPGTDLEATPMTARVSIEGEGNCRVAVSAAGAAEAEFVVFAAASWEQECFGTGEGDNGEDANPIMYCADDVSVQVSLGQDGPGDAAIDQGALVRAVHAAAVDSLAEAAAAAYSYDPQFPTLTVGSTAYRAFDLQCWADEADAPFTVRLTYGTPAASFTMTLNSAFQTDDGVIDATIFGAVEGSQIVVDPRSSWNDDPPALATKPGALSVTGGTVALADSDWYDWSLYTGFGSEALIHTDAFAITCPVVYVDPRYAR